MSIPRHHLVQIVRQFDGCVVAFSGGVDSAVVAKVAFDTLGSRAIAVTGVSASLASSELEHARHTARIIGIQHHLVRTDEVAQPAYRRNDADRCFHCKNELYAHLRRFAHERGLSVIANGANLDDTSDHRPGLRAARDHNVRSPLVEAGLRKQDVRNLARQWELPVWDKPASPCLSSRIAYGTEVTSERLRRVERAEQILRQLGLADLRVRYHDGDLARIEVAVDQIQRLARPSVRKQIAEQFRALGFEFVTLDLDGFRSGSLNQMIDIQDLRKPQTQMPAAIDEEHR